VLFIPIIIGSHWIFPWRHGDWVDSDDILKNKQVYLNLPFFVGRAVLYFIIWTVLAGNLRRWSLQQDTGNHPETKQKMASMSGPGLLLYFLTVTFVSVDWVQSRDPHWYSTVQGLLISVGMSLSGMAFMIVLLNLITRHHVFIRQPHGPDLVTSDELPLADFSTQARLNDLGNFLFMLVILWAYMATAQLVVIWMGNTNEDITWYTERGMDAVRPNGWRWYGLALVILHFFVPFLLLLSRFNKRRLWILGAIALGVFIMRAFDMIWLFNPTNINPHATDLAASIGSGPLDILWSLIAPLGIGGLWFGGFVRALESRPIIPPYDPQTDELIVPDPQLAHSGGQAEAGIHTPHENTRARGFGELSSEGGTAHA
ncbi:MAG: hypothetical protein JO353_06325, partial [Phycisphaerae bacterium]|nr:hypothetical protein [Phycisphaerae bacterium]